MGKRFPVAITISRKGGDAVIHWEEGTDDDLIRILRPLLRAADEMDIWRIMKNASVAGGAAADAGEPLVTDSPSFYHGTEEFANEH